ncbi:MAG TPA: metallophosphoesterase [Actinomycetota bacterium]|nr:metallophosphoesterase [Actinomycetota bacterium]
MIRLAAVGDVHCGADVRSQVRSQFASVPDHADALLLAGDLTRLGLPEEAEVLADSLEQLRGMPIAGVLGNHDYQSDRQDEVRDIIEAAGVQVLEGSSVVWEIGSVRVAVAGSKGFGGGFEGTHATAFGEAEMKRFVQHTHALTDRLDACLRDLDPADLTVLLLHYAPVRETLTGEPREIFPFLGSYLFAELADRHGVDLVLHGHAHRGIERGRTTGGIPVRNVAQAVIQQGYAVYTLDPAGRGSAVGDEASVSPARSE